MVFQFPPMQLQILSSSIDIASRFLPTPSDESKSSFWPEIVLEQQSKCLKDSDKSSSVIIGTSLRSSVPSINMSASQHNLVRVCASLDLEDQVVRITVTDKFVLHDEMKHNFLSSRLHSLHHVGIFGGYGSTWYFRLLRIVLHIACMDGLYADWRYGTDQHGLSAVFGSSRGTINSIFNGMMIVDPLVVEDDNLSWNLIFMEFEFVPVSQHYRFCLNVSSYTSSQSDDFQWRRHWSWRCHHKALFSTNPFCEIFHSLQMDIIKSFFPSLFLHFSDDLFETV